MQSTPLRIKVIIGSTREGRFSEKPAQYIFDELKKKDGVEAELLDLRDFPMPFYDSAMTPKGLGGKYPHEFVQAWADKISDGDAFIIVHPEYNHGYSAVLKNALDWLYPEWNRKAVGFVSFGSAMGARGMEQLRQVAVELQMAPIRQAVHIPGQIYMAVAKEQMPVSQDLFKPLREPNDQVETFFNDLIWWGKALQQARQVQPKKAVKIAG